MKNNRQIGLDGKIFISTSIRRGTFFVFMLMLYGIITAVADILKLTGESGVAMGSFTTTLLIYDFVVSLMLVVVVFYAYFLECGADVPVLKEKPLMLFGFFRLGYYLLLTYYLCYRMLYCVVNHETVSTSVGIFYLVYLCLIILLILANCYIFNIITRNLIRRSYEKSFHRIAVVGFIVQALLPVSYILARVFMDDIGDEYFTTAVCDLIRLLVAPMLLTSVWFLFLHAVGQVHDVYSEVDSALKNKRYQITYSSESTGKKYRRKGASAPPATTTLLPAGASAAAAIADNVPKALKESAAESLQNTAVPSSVEETPETVERSDNNEASDAEVTIDAAPTTVEKVPEITSPGLSEDEIIASFATEARKAVAKTSVQNNSKKQKTNGSDQSPKAAAQHVRQNPIKSTQTTQPRSHVQVQNTLPVQEFDPYPAASVPYRPQKQNAAQSRQPQPNRNSNHARPANPQNQTTVRPPQADRQQNSRPVSNNNNNRPSQQRSSQNGQHSQSKQPQRQNNQRSNNHR